MVAGSTAELTFAELQTPRLSLPQETPYERDGWTRCTVSDPERFRADHATLADDDRLPGLLGFMPRYRLTLNASSKSLGRDWHCDHHPSRGDDVPQLEATLFLALGLCPSGTIELISGSHHWPPVERETLHALFGGHQRQAEPHLGNLLRAQGFDSIRPALERGDLLVWHPWLWHRSDENKEREAIVVRSAT